jgi:putative transposase
MLQNHSLAKSIADASWGTFIEILEDKAARAGHQVVKVPARFTSQKCHRCGEIVQKSLSVRTHLCPSCGSVEDRDVNAAKNILQAGAPPSGTVRDTGPDELRSPDL